MLKISISTQVWGGAKNLLLLSVFAVFVLVDYTLYWNATRDIRIKYSGAQQAASVIEALPDDAVIFENAEDFCNAVIPYLKTKKIYNPFQEKIASYIDRNPKLRHSMSYSEFTAVIQKMFPDLKDFWLLASINGNKIKDLQDYLLSEDIYYSDESQKIIANEHFIIYHVKLKRE